jgi:S1-C subfamily serine protease
MQKNTLLYSLIASALLTTGVAHAQTSASASKENSAPSDLSSERREMDQLRDQMRELSRKMADLSEKVGDVGPRAYAYRYLGNPGRGMVGLVLESDEHGLRVKAVTPGSASDKAGIRNNDVIVAIDGKPTVGDKNDSAIHGLSLGDVKVDQAVKLRVLRDGKTSEYTVKAERREPYGFAYAFNDDGDLSKLSALNAEAWSKEVQDRVKAETDAAMQKAQVYAQAGKRLGRSLGQMNLMTPWWGLNLASLNPDLGGYFGTDKGVLVLSADDEDFKQLKSGDVLEQVAGTKIERPEDAFRILREQKPGSQVKIDVLRQHKPMTLSLRAPESANIFVPPPPPPPPAPPAPPLPHLAVPAPPVPPAPPAPPAEKDDNGSV